MKKEQNKTNNMKLLKVEAFKPIGKEESHFVEIKDLKRDDIFYEGTALTENFELVVLTNPKKTQRGWECKVQNTQGTIIDIYMAHDTNYPSPDFYRVPQNIEKLDNGKFVHKVY